MISFHLSPAEASLLVNSLAYNLEFASLESSARKRMLLLKGKITNEILDDQREKEIDNEFQKGYVAPGVWINPKWNVKHE